jgi:hypothetical protein
MEEGEEIDPAQIVNTIEDVKQRRLLAEVLFSKYQLSKGWEEVKVHVDQANPEKIAGDAIVALRRRGLERMLEENQRHLKSAAQRGEDAMPYLERHTQIMQELKALESKPVQ